MTIKDAVNYLLVTAARGKYNLSISTLWSQSYIPQLSLCERMAQILSLLGRTIHYYSHVAALYTGFRIGLSWAGAGLRHFSNSRKHALQTVNFRLEFNYNKRKHSNIRIFDRRFILP